MQLSHFSDVSCLNKSENISGVPSMYTTYNMRVRNLLFWPSSYYGETVLSSLLVKCSIVLKRCLGRTLLWALRIRRFSMWLLILSLLYIEKRGLLVVMLDSRVVWACSVFLETDPLLTLKPRLWLFIDDYWVESIPAPVFGRSCTPWFLS